VVTVPANGSASLRFQAALPDLVGSYEITSTVKVGGVTLLGSPTLALEVTRTVEGALSDAIAALEAMSVVPEDQGHLESAVARLRAAQRAGPEADDLEAKIHLATEADKALGRIKSADLKEVRLAVDLVVAAWERVWFEAASSASAGSGLLHAAAAAGDENLAFPPGSLRFVNLTN
jgi:hypothetical protein